MKSIANFLAIPEFEDEEQAYSARLLKLFLITTIVCSIIAIPVAHLAAPVLAFRVTIGAISLILISIGLFLALKKGHVRWTAIVFICLTWLIFLVLSISGNGVRAPLFIGGSLLVIFISGLLVGNRFGIVFTAVCVVASLLMALAEDAGILSPNPLSITPLGAWLISSLFFGAAAFMQRATRDTLQSALDRANHELEERRQIQAEQDKTLNLLLNVINSSPELIFAKDMNLRTVMCNDKLAELLGKTPQEMYGKDDIENGWPEELVNGAPEKGIRGFRLDDLDVLAGRMIHNPREIGIKDGEPHFYDMRKMPLRDGKGSITGLLGVAYDVTELVRSQESEHRLLSGLKNVIDATNELIHIESEDQLHRRAVELAREKIGVERCGLYLLDASGRFLSGTYGTDEYGSTTVERNVRIVSEVEMDLFSKPGESWHIRNSQHTYYKKGERIHFGEGWIVATILQSEQGPQGVMYNDAAISGSPLNPSIQETLAVYCSVLGSIIERKKAKTNEQLLMNNLRGVIEAANELMGIYDIQEFYKRSVELAREKLGVERCGLHILDEDKRHLFGTYGTDDRGNTTDESDITQEIELTSDVLPPPGKSWKVSQGDHVYWIDNILYMAGEGWIVTTPILSTSGPIGVMYNDTAISKSPVSDTVQESLAVYCSILGNMIERKRLEERLIEQQDNLESLVHKRTAALEMSNHEMEAFTYSVSHDLRAPLRAIAGYARILQSDYSNSFDNQASAYLQNIRQSAQQMGQLIDDLLSLTRLGRQSVNRRTISSVEMIDMVRQICEEVASSVPSQKVEFSVKSIMPCQADLTLLRQILTNLINNAIKYSNTREISRVEIGSVASENGSAYYVKDNGIGFDMKYAEKIFAPFQRLHTPHGAEGTGIGLAIVQRSVEKHGGLVWVDSKEGEGSIFYFTLGE